MGVISLVRDPYTPSFATATRQGLDPNYYKHTPRIQMNFSLSAPGVYPQKLSQNRQSLNQRRCGEKTRPSATEMLGNFAEFHLNCHRKNNLAKF